MKDKDIEPTETEKMLLKYCSCSCMECITMSFTGCMGLVLLFCCLLLIAVIVIASQMDLELLEFKTQIDFDLFIDEKTEELV